ncbi:MAG: hypothetical protein LBU73_04015 [Helicobacteraceae bacterium]|nr:hypothetical protein [Helicobacteraceae bacterium]
MKLFSGFGFKNEFDLFHNFLPENYEKTQFSTAGFSMGAIKAVLHAIQSENRVEKLYLFSPAFFQDKDDNFRENELKIFAEKQELYMKFFYRKCGKINDEYKDKNPNINDLKFLLNHKWELNDFNALKNTEITIFLGEKDAIMDSKKAMRFFAQTHAQIFYIKNANHTLQGGLWHN